MCRGTDHQISSKAGEYMLLPGMKRVNTSYCSRYCLIPPDSAAGQTLCNEEIKDHCHFPVQITPWAPLFFLLPEGVNSVFSGRKIWMYCPQGRKDLQTLVIIYANIKLQVTITIQHIFSKLDWLPYKKKKEKKRVLFSLIWGKDKITIDFISGSVKGGKRVTQHCFLFLEV